MKYLKVAALILSFQFAGPAIAGGHIHWKTLADESSVAFGSVKKDTIGEVHHFSGVEGSINEQGKVSLTIDLATVETNIGIRNERMIEHVFKKGTATASLSGEVSMSEVNAITIGATKLVKFAGKLSFAGVEVDVNTDMLVARLSEDRILVTTANMVMLSTAVLGIDAGVDKLMELAGLPGITRVSPVTARMVFKK